MFDRVGRWLGQYLERDRARVQPFIAQDHEALAATIRPGDVLLIEGRAKISTAIKYLTQSTWSHATMCVSAATRDAPPMLVEVTLEDGCHRVPVSKYAPFNTRLCRAASLSDEEREDLARFMLSAIGMRYDLRNVFDLARYLFPTPPVPVRWRRHLLEFGSGDPTRAICSSLIAQAFEAVRYPILPEIRMVRVPESPRHEIPVWVRRHPSLVVPRDFDLSPYFAVIKPTIQRGFDHHRIHWQTVAKPGEIVG